MIRWEHLTLGNPERIRQHIETFPGPTRPHIYQHCLVPYSLGTPMQPKVLIAAQDMASKRYIIIQTVPVDNSIDKDQSPVTLTLKRVSL